MTDNIEIGQSLARTEDRRFITGEGRYLDDIQLDNAAVMMFYRSPHASGKITQLDIADALAIDGVLAIYTATDLAAAGITDVPAGAVPRSRKHPGRAAVAQPPLAREEVRYVGEPVAAIVAEHRAAAQLAIEKIVFSVEHAGTANDIRSALTEGAARVHDSIDDNILGILEQGDEARTEAAFADAASVIKLDVVNNRLAPSALEPRGCAATYDESSGEYVLYQGCQGVHSLRDRVLQCMPIDAQKLHVVCPDVGGGFGFKAFLQCETVSVLHATKSLGRPVKWLADRRESFLSDLHGRDHLTHAELAVDNDGRFLALRVHIDSNVGAYQSQAGALIAWIGAYMTTGCYRIAAAYTSIRLVLTNTVPVDAYRGAGRPEALYLIERLVDKAARELGIAPDELRSRNFIPADAFPFQVPTGPAYDTGDYDRLMHECMQRADWQGFTERREASREAGMLRGIGLAYYVEICAGFGQEQTTLEFEADGSVTARVGTQSTGQGHETSFAQIIARRLGIDIARVRVLQGDTREIATGEGTGGSRTMAIAGSALRMSADLLIENARQQAAALLDVSVEDLSFADGRLQTAGGASLSIDEVARASFDESRVAPGVTPGLLASAVFKPDAGTFPNGCHICETEIDPETGAVQIVNYTVQDDVGNVINPLLLQGQIMGGVAQGLGQALMERAIYSPDTSQLLSTSFLDYAMPSADDMPDMDFAITPVPSPRNPLGVKGAGEAGTIGAPPALVNAVVDALYEFGIDHIDMPVTPMAVWQALSGAAKKTKRKAA